MVPARGISKRHDRALEHPLVLVLRLGLLEEAQESRGRVGLGDLRIDARGRKEVSDWDDLEKAVAAVWGEGAQWAARSLPNR